MGNFIGFSSSPTSQQLRRRLENTRFCFRVSAVIITPYSLPLLWDTKSATHAEEVIIFIHIDTLVPPRTSNYAVNSEDQLFRDADSASSAVFFPFWGGSFFLPLCRSNDKDNDSSCNCTDSIAFERFDMDSLPFNH